MCNPRSHDCSNLLPGELSETSSARDYFNRLSDTEWARVRDFITLHYFANNREGEFWDLCREMRLPDTLLEKIALFREAGLVIREEDELFLDDSWGQVMIGQGILPKAGRRLPTTSRAKTSDLSSRVSRIAIESGPRRLPTHRQFVASMVGDEIRERQ